MLINIDPKALEHACQCAGRSVHHFDRMGDDLPLRASIIAHARAIEQHEAFAQEVSDAVEDIAKRREAQWLAAALDRFIIPKPVDPLVEALNKMPGVCSNEFDADDAMYLRAALAARGLEIREKQ